MINSKATTAHGATSQGGLGVKVILLHNNPSPEAQNGRRTEEWNTKHHVPVGTGRDIQEQTTTRQMLVDVYFKQTRSGPHVHPRPHGIEDQVVRQMADWGELIITTSQARCRMWSEVGGKYPRWLDPQKPATYPAAYKGKEATRSNDLRPATATAYK
jgi:hypothetical protein